MDKNRRLHFTNRRVGDKVRITRADSIKHRYAGGQTASGEIIHIDLDHKQGGYWRPFLICFDSDGHESWWASWEIKKVKS